uniref:Uncharacterized protein n=1 Tax=Cryptococcus bacillisporus CA1280 TaxID=1296109 RepID=A0A0D0URC0_CRYGA|nr:hypothetical protein I312_00589 [Cryptococcus bacillisporus CA1280]
MLRTSRLIPPKKEDGSARPIVGELRRFTGCYGLILSATSNWADDPAHDVGVRNIKYAEHTD